MDRYLSGKAPPSQYQGEINARKHLSEKAFVQVSVLLRFDQQDGKVTTDHHVATSNFPFEKTVVHRVKFSLQNVM